MRRILYKKRHSFKNRRKSISIAEFSEDKECRTVVRKAFVYKVQESHAMDFQAQAPQIYIKKIVDNKRQEEYFQFRVKGSFYLKHDRHGYQVDFCHTLKIQICWKAQVFSPKKSETLT